MKWLYHLVPRGQSTGDPYTPVSLALEGFVHASYKEAVLESARLYFSGGPAPDVWRIDPRLLTVPVEEAATPRGPMPHIHGPIPAAAIVEVLSLNEMASAPDSIA